MDVKCDDRELVITASETFFEKYLKIMKEEYNTTRNKRFR